MDQITQANAANAQESASVSDELSTEAEHLNAMVTRLIGIIGGAGSEPHRTAAAASPALSAPKPKRGALPAPGRKDQDPGIDAF
jgi:methyl-accepting chemotaxis protein